MLQKNILFEDEAVRQVLMFLVKKGITYNSIIYTNRGRYAIAKGSNAIAILLKTEPFFNFGYKFRAIGEKGVGDSINCEHLKEFIRHGVEYIYTMFRDGKMYRISLIDFRDKSHRWMQKEGTEVRSISIHHYIRQN
ncbi:MAG: hypothetical protein U9R08_03540 [Nanoarchaeota archaeon]|nr:hypothetical protein [Nanoarchaeota archaeon]